MPIARWVLRVALAGALTATASAQSSVTTITPVPAGANFTVDGMTYTKATSFSWPAGSAHIVAVPNPVQNGALTNTQLTFVNIAWKDGTYSTTSVIITADPSITNYTVNFAEAFAMNILFYSCGSGGGCSGSPGSVVLNNGTPVGPWNSATVYNSGDIVTLGSLNYISRLNLNIGNDPANSPVFWAPSAPVTVTSSQQVYWPAGSQVILQAFPNQGFVFTGWSSVAAGEIVLDTR